MHKAVTEILCDKDYEIVEQFDIAARDPVYKEIPRFLYDSRVGQTINKMVNGTGNVWNHQSVALEKINDKNNVVISTGTASGKSLIFHSASFHRTLLDGKKRVLVFYPLKALASDQLTSWKKTSNEMGLPDNYVEKIDGSVEFTRRDEILKSSHIVLMTPDVCHAWMMSNLASPVVKQFLRSVDLIVLDEAHTLEGVFGSNFSFLFRRLLVARNNLLTADEREERVNVIAATATISNPSEHLKELTGLEFDEVGPDEDGSPQYTSVCVHVAIPDGQEMITAKSLHIALLRSSNEGGFITFVDSRKGVELLAAATNAKLKEESNDSEIMPYRAGYAVEDRKAIEGRLKNGTLRGVVSTPALELGIDLPHLQVGINIGVPASRKSYRQRLGRVGRSGPGAFIVLAERNAFIQFGTTYKQYHDMSVEPSYLYLDNRFMQYAHATCLADELESVNARDKSILPSRVHWPDGFGEVFKAARPGSDRPREFDAIAQLGGDAPQRNYPLRNVGEVNFKITIGDTANELGDASLSQALRECYPGATYYHLAKTYKVTKWVTTSYQSAIQVKARQFLPVTKPRIRTWINAGVTPIDLVDGHLRQGSKGMIAECQMQITEIVEGFQEGDGQYMTYRERRVSNPNMRQKTRQFRTTGVLISIDDDWFSKANNKSFVAEKLKNMFLREYSVLPQDVGVSATNISVTTEDGSKARSDCIVLFDQTYGSLRLTEHIYSDITSMIGRMKVAAESEHGSDREEYNNAIKCLEEFTDSLDDERSVETFKDNIKTVNGDLLRVYAAGSRVGYREQGFLYTDIEVIMPAIMGDMLMYQVKCPPKNVASQPAKKWVSSAYLEPIASEGEWSYALWNPHTQEYETGDDSEDDFINHKYPEDSLHGTQMKTDAEMDGSLLDGEDFEEIIMPGSTGLDYENNMEFCIDEVSYLPEEGLAYKGRRLINTGDNNGNPNLDEDSQVVILPVAAICGIPGVSKTGKYCYNTAEVVPDEIL